jgi:polyhydroxyalkanoate synthesis repressor PhaR
MEIQVNTKSRLILKYGNRRLYDTTTHRYVTLEDMRQLVLHHVDFVVRDKGSQADITLVTLLNVLLHSAAGRPELSLNPQLVLDAIRMQAQSPEVRVNPETAREHSLNQQVAY